MYLKKNGRNLLCLLETYVLEKKLKELPIHYVSLLRSKKPVSVKVFEIHCYAKIENIYAFNLTFTI